MKIRALHLEHFRKFVDPVSLTGFEDGINILSECNEFGKSTLLAAIRGVLFERFGSKAQSVQGMRHWVNRTAPVIMLEFELDDGVYRIDKRFLEKPYARLTLPDGTQHEGDAAEDCLQRLLHFARPGSKGARPEDTGMWAALWVTQRESVQLPELYDAARRTIHQCLEREVGALAGRTRGAALLEAVRSEIAALRNGVQKPVGRYKEALAELEKAKLYVEELERKQRDLARDLDALATLERALAQAASSDEEAHLDADLAEARRKKEAAERYEDQEQRDEANYKLAENCLSELEKIAEQRVNLRQRMEMASQKVALALAAAGNATKSREAAANALAAQLVRARSAEDARDVAGERARESRDLAELARHLESTESLSARLAEAEEAQQRIDRLEANLLSATVTEDGVQAIQEAATSLEKVSAVLEAQASLVLLDIPEDAKTRLRVNGVAYASEPELRVIEDLVLEAEGIGTITVRPGIQDREVQLGHQAAAERALRNRLMAVQVSTLEEARTKLAELQAYGRELTSAKKELQRLTPADPKNNVAAGMEALKNRVSTLRAALHAELSRKALQRAPSSEAVQQALMVTEEEERKLSDAISVARAPLASSQQAHTRAVRMEAEAHAALNVARRLSDDLSTQYAQALQRESEEALATRRAAAAQDLRVKRCLLEARQREKPADSAAAMETRISRLEHAKRQLQADLNKKRQDKAVLESRIEREAGTGIEEQLAEVGRQKDLLQRRVDHIVHELSVLDLLYGTLESAERKAKERYMAPMVERVVPYLRRLFPGATIQCDENFTVTGVFRTADERFDGLSDGTQEQIAVLTRLAFADMLLDSGHPAMLILDDALAYSDRGRLETMFDLLAEASARMQILVLTCREDAFRRLGGKRLRLVGNFAA